MKIKVLEVCEDRRNWKKHIVKTYEVEGNTLEDCFKKAYPYERSLRYCNGYWIEFETEELNKKYREWKVNGVDIMMYYGGGVID